MIPFLGFLFYKLFLYKMIELGKGIYEHELLGLFWGYNPRNEEDRKVYDLLSRICRAWVIDRNRDNDHEIICDITLNSDEQEFVNAYNLTEHPNLEVRTRFMDVMMRFSKGRERLDRMRKTSDGYIALYKETGTVLYFVRAIEVRQSRLLYDESFMSGLSDMIVSSLIYPSWLVKVLNQVKLNVTDGLNNSYLRSIIDAYALVKSEDVHWRDQYWDMLYGIGYIDGDEWHYQKALNWESYADRIEANKKENVFNANYHAILQDAHNEMFHVKERHLDDYKRIRDKYNVAKRDFVEALSLFGVRFKYQVPDSVVEEIHKQMAALKFETLDEVLLSYLRIPFYPSWKKLVEKEVEKSKKQSDVIERFFPNSQTLDEEGNVSGISDFEHNQHIQVHRYIRATLMYQILCLYVRVEEHTLDYSEGLFYHILKECKPSFIEDDRVQVWAKAYLNYFNGDILVASHLLMPQLEHALHNLLEEIVDDVTMLNNDVQKEPTLMGILNQLRPYCNDTLYDELTMFLVDGNDVNYRNRLLHGLIGSMETLRHGHYLFYLSNLFFFTGKNFLIFGSNVHKTKQKGRRDRRATDTTKAVKMTQDERWLKRYEEVYSFIKLNKRNPSRHRIEEHDYLNWLKANRKILNAGRMKPERIEKFRKLLEMTEQYRRKNQYE